MDIQSVYSNKTNINEVVLDVKQQLKGFDAKVLICFSSSIFDSTSISKQLQESFPEVQTFGCSTAGEIISGQMLKNSVVVMAFSAAVIADAKIEVIENIKEDGNVKKAFEAFNGYFNEKLSHVDVEKYVGIVLIDGLSASEEKIMDRIGDQTNCHIIGGSAGDDLKFSKTFVYANGIAYSDAAILAILKPKNGYDIIKTQSFDVLPKTLVATKVDLENREVIEFDHKPAVEAYAEALGVSKEKVGDCFMTNPVGVVVDSEVFVRSPQRIVDDKIVFYCNIMEGTEVSLLRTKDIVKDTTQAIDEKVKELGKVSGIINFHCILRTLELENKGQTEDYGKIFSDIPTIGFSTYGEEYVGHINQTSTILVFK